MKMGSNPLRDMEMLTFTLVHNQMNCDTEVGSREAEPPHNAVGSASLEPTCQTCQDVFGRLLEELDAQPGILET